MSVDRSRIDFTPNEQRLVRGLAPPFWILSDPHWGHLNLCRPEYESRPDDFTRQVADGWSQTVGEDDWIVVMGDLAMTRDEDGLERFMQAMPGHKILIYGNHDRKGARYYQRLGFDVTCRGFELRYRDHRILFSHRPDDQAEFVRYPQHLNMHGHVHAQTRQDRRLINCCVEVLGYTPVAVSDVLDARIDELTGKSRRATA
jgi:calcineurin-like phosphoesterase family protein